MEKSVFKLTNGNAESLVLDLVIYRFTFPWWRLLNGFTP